MRRRLASGVELERLRRHIDNLFTLVAGGAEAPADAWSPAVDLIELPDRVVVRVDLPDVERSDVEIRLVNRELHVSGCRRTRQVHERRRYHRMERGAGPFAIELLLPGLVDPGACRAALAAGVLEISLPLLYGRRDAVHVIEISEEEP